MATMVLPTPTTTKKGAPSIANAPRVEFVDEDQIVLLPNATWDDYKRFQEFVERVCRGKVRLLDGWLEIMTVSKRHEQVKKILAYLLENFLDQQDLEWFPCGEATLEKMADESGGQPDESYWFDEIKTYPDLAIEIALTSGGIGKLAFYERYKIPEVWIWTEESLTAFRLTPEGYVKLESSEWVPNLDLRRLGECAKMFNPREARKQFFGDQL